MNKLSMQLHTTESASPTCSTILENAQKGLGFIPNMYAGMANNTALLDGYINSYKSFRENSGFTPQEQEVIFLSIAVQNGCTYCAAAHSFVADNMSNVPTEITDAIRNSTPIPDAKLSALSTFTQLMVEKRGNPNPTDISTFLEAGFTEENVLGIIAGIGIKTFSNYFNHVFDTPLDDVFKTRKWEPVAV